MHDHVAVTTLYVKYLIIFIINHQHRILMWSVDVHVGLHATVHPEADHCTTDALVIHLRQAAIPETLTNDRLCCHAATKKKR